MKKKKEIDEDEMIFWLSAVILVTMWLSKYNLRFHLNNFSFETIFILLAAWAIAKGALEALRRLKKLGFLSAEDAR